ncbi:PREDICTED: NACHT, LRR and PYD domains-containing protein 13-like [Hipposideros armiger]|uniref:NACHT, LRR and PYD domains-containing protein 13-like n=1 Tax=Hipposideros armiger TaxID=186990 RepID=A0A8B7Q4L9_HIPAR|nr:PREDICTED: NACHT, LRR and PYD domains-containing protein 13-like [Hipposideros armiger]
MNSSANVSVDNCTCDKLLSHLRGLDQHQLEEFKLGLQSPQLLPENFQQIPWANLKAADPTNLLCLLSEYFPERQMWEVTLRIFESMNLTSLCEEVKTEMNEMAQAQGPQDSNQEEPEMPGEESVHRRTYRERMKAKMLVMWDNIHWPEDHIYLCNVTEHEHEVLKRLVYPNRTGAQPQTIVLEGMAGVGKTTLAVKVMLHWAEGFLFHQRFSYVFYISCHRVREMKDTTFADLLSQDWPKSQAPIEEFMSHPERLLFIIDGFEEMTMPSNLADSLQCTDWYQKLPVARILFHLLKKELVPTATLLITTRDYSSKDLKKLLLNPQFVLISGFTEGDKEEYFFRYFGDQDKTRKILHWIQNNKTLFHSCSAPLVCWIVCSCLKRQMTRCPHFQLSTQTTTSLYAYFFSSSFTTADFNWSEQSWPEQWRALCSLAADGMWSSNFTFAKEDIEHQHLQAPLIDFLFRLNILQKVSDCENCITFTHQSLQVFLGAMFYVLRGMEGSTGSLATHQEMRVLLNDAFTDKNFYWHQMALFFFGLLKRDLTRELEDTLHCRLSPRIMDELLEWAEELLKYDMVSFHFEFFTFFQCLYETQEENFVKQILNYLPEADLDILGDLQLQVSSFCLKHCQRLSKLRLSVSCLNPQKESTFNQETLRMELVNLKICQWEDICSVFHNGNLSELDLSNSKLNATSMKKLCYKLRNPRCRLQKLTCKSVTPVRVLKELVLVLYGNNRLTHLNLSSNNLGITVSTMIFRTLRHSACNLKYLCLEKCNLSAASSEGLALLLTSTERTTRLCLGFNQLQDDGVRWLCASLSQPECALERLVLWFCQLGMPSCRYLSDALLQNKSLTHLNLRKNHLGDEGVRLLCGALSHPDCSLQNLDLSECSVTAEGCWELADILKHNHNVKVLDLGKNRVQDEGVRRLCEVLHDSLCALNTLGLEKCDLTSACCQHLASVLRSSKSLMNLNLLGNDLGSDGVNKLWKSLKKSKCKLRKLG